MSLNGSESASRLSVSSPRGFTTRKELSENAVNVDEVSTVDSGGDGTTQALDNCGLLPNNCLPCLAPTAFTVDKKRPSSPGPSSFKRKMPSKLSFKWKEGQNSDLSLSEYSVLSLSINMGNHWFIQILVQ